VTATEQRTGPSPERIRTRYHIQAAVALDTIDLLAERVQNLLKAGRRMTLVRRWADRDNTPTVTAGLTLFEEPRLRHQDDGGAGFGVHLRPGIHGFGFSAYACDGNTTEAEVWKRYHADKGDDHWTRRRNITVVEIDGGMADSGPGRDDQLTIRHWNEHGVCEEIVVAFDPGPSPYAEVLEELEEDLATYQSAVNKDAAELGRIVGLQDAIVAIRKATER
jgi:hypothetical protein